MTYRNDDTDLTVMDWFCGAGGSSQGMHSIPNVRMARAANHWERAIESHAANFPTVDHYRGDIREAPVETWPVTDIFWASPECFPAGTLILARRGLVPIQEIRIGDEVFTHERRWRPVVATMHRPADTVLVKGVGLAGGIETTSEHPFFTRRRNRVWDQPNRRWNQELTDTAEWTEAKDLIGHLWATPIDFGEELPVPAVPGRGMDFDADFWWLVGRWLGDGSLRLAPKTGGGLDPQPRRASRPVGSACIVCSTPARSRSNGTSGRVSPYCSDACKNTNKRQNPNRGRFDVTIVCGFHESEDLAKRLGAVDGLRWQHRELRTASAFTTAHRGLVEWLAEHFGQHAHGKAVPAWALTMPVAWRQALLTGYLSADGHHGPTTTQVSTVSKSLAIGVRLLANSVGEVANIAGPYKRGGERKIEGRVVNERPFWSLSWVTDGPRHAYHSDADGYRWAPVRSVTETGRRVDVYNITVAEDESYVADGVTVHNCPQWSNARGKKRDFDASLQGDLFDGFGPTEEEERSRALMEEVPMYLRGVQQRGGLVKAGVVENVVDVRAWDQWDRWIGEIRKLGYETRVIALNSMHADPRTVHKAPQSRDRLYVAYWHRSLGRTPDWDKWLRPRAWCTGCDTWVQAVQRFKAPGRDMGRYRQQYVYRCPNATCRSQIVEPETLPAAVAIDWTLPGQRIGDKPLKEFFSDKAKTESLGFHPLAPKTLARIEAGLKKFAQPLVVPAGGTWRNDATPAVDPMPTRTTRENDGLAVPPLLIPVEGRDGKEPGSAHAPLRTQTARNETGLAWLPFMVTLRGGGDQLRGRSIAEPVGTVSANGNHHGLVTPDIPAMVMRNNTPRGSAGQMCTSADEYFRTMTTAGHQSLVTWEHLLVPYYGNGTAKTVREPVGTLSTRDRYALVQGNVDIQDVLFRMLEPHEIGRAMSFGDDYIVLGNKREKVRQLGNAVTPPAAEVIVAALVEAITGEELDRYAESGLAVAA